MAGNPAIGEALVRVLAPSGEKGVRRALAGHPELPFDVLLGPARTPRTGPDLLPRVAAATPAEPAGAAASP